MVTVDSNLPGSDSSAYTYEFDYKPDLYPNPPAADGSTPAPTSGWGAPPGQSSAVVLYWGTEHWNDPRGFNQVTTVMWNDNNYMNIGHGTHGNPVAPHSQYIRARLRSAEIGCRSPPPGWTYEECVAANPWEDGVTYTGPGYDLSNRWQANGFPSPHLNFHTIRVTRESKESSNPGLVTVYVDGHMVARRRQAGTGNMPQCGGSTPSSSGVAVTGWADACRKLYILGRPVHGVLTNAHSFGTVKNIKIWSSVVPP